MKERLKKALAVMEKRRDQLLDEYLLSLERPEWDANTSMAAIVPAQRLHDCDRHVTNLHLELKRLELASPKKEVAEVAEVKAEEVKVADAS